MKSTIKLIMVCTVILAAGFAMFSCDIDNASGKDEDPDLSGEINITTHADGPFTGKELTATYDGTEAVSFQWKKGENNVGSASIANPNKYTPSEAGIYSVTVSASGYKSKTSTPVTVTVDGNITDVPDLLPSNWQSYTYNEWKEWTKGIGIITAQKEEEFKAFIIENYDALSEGGKQYWKNILPVDTHGIDIGNWPQDDNKNKFSEGLYWRKSEDGQAIAINPMGRGDGTNYSPDIFVLEEGSGGEFPIGTWVNREDETLVFTPVTIKFDTPYEYDLWQVDYSILNNIFTASNYQTIPYTPTAEDNAKLEDFNEASLRTERPWIPATSEIEVKVKRDNWFYTIVDNPVMTPFVSNDNIIGTWLVCDFTDDPNTYDPLNPERPDYNSWEGIQFLSDGTVQYLWSDTWNNGGTWTTTTSTYAGSRITNSITGGIIDEPGGNNIAPEFVVKKYIDDFYLFAQWKSGDYTTRAEEPRYYVFRKE